VDLVAIVMALSKSVVFEKGCFAPSSCHCAVFRRKFSNMTNVTIDALRRKGIHGEAEFDDRIAPANVDPGSRTTPSAVPLPHIKLEQNEIRQRIDEGRMSGTC
jgi:hypothetical protein